VPERWGGGEVGEGRRLGLGVIIYNSLAQVLKQAGRALASHAGRLGLNLGLH